MFDTSAFTRTAPLNGPEHDEFRATTRRFIHDEVMPHHDRWERDGQVPKALWQRAGQLGLLCPTMPEEYGGSEASFAFSAIIAEEMASAGATGPLFYLHSDIVAPYLLHYGNQQQKQRWLPPMARGEVITAIGMTEPDTGSDLAAIRTTAVPEGDHWRVNGQKIFISNGQIADLIVLAVKTDPSAGTRGISLLLVDASTPGYSRGRKLDKLGMHAQDTSELFFTDMLIPKDNLLGQLHQGMHYLMQQLPQERLLVAIGAVAAMEAAVEWTRDYLCRRKAFGVRLADKQALRHRLTEAYGNACVARSFLNDCLSQHLQGKLSAETASLAKYWTSEMQFQVIDNCLQMFGGYGYMREYPIARAWADARAQRIYGGTTEIMKEIIARKLLDAPKAV